MNYFGNPQRARRSFWSPENRPIYGNPPTIQAKSMTITYVASPLR